MTATSDISELAAQVEYLTARLQQLTETTTVQRFSNPWLPLKEAAAVLHYPSAQALRQHLRKGRFPTDCYRAIPGPSGTRCKYLVNVEQYLKTLR